MPLEGKFLCIALIIVRVTLNVIVRQMPLNNGVSIVQKHVVKVSNCEHFDNVFATGRNNIVGLSIFSCDKGSA